MLTHPVAGTIAQRLRRPRPAVITPGPGAPPEAVVRASLAAFNARDLDATLACFAPDATYEWVGQGPPLTREPLGLALWRLFQRDARLVARRLVAAGDTVMGEYALHFTDPQGAAHETRCASIHTVRGGLIVRVQQYAAGGPADPLDG